MRICADLLLFGMCLLVSSAIRADDVADALKLLKSEQSEVRYDAARKLTRLGSAAETAIPALISALGDHGFPTQDRVQFFGPRVRDVASKALVRIGRPSVPALADALSHEDRSIREMAARTLGELRHAAISSFPALQQRLNDPDKWVRRSVISALGKVGVDRDIVVPILTEIIRADEFWSARTTALEVLFDADPGGELAVPILIVSLASDDGEVLSAAALTLAKFRGNSLPALGILEMLLETTKQRLDGYNDIVRSAPVRSDIVRALGAIGPEALRLVPRLIQIAQLDEDEGTRAWAAAAVVRISPEHPFAEVAITRIVESKAFEVLGEIGSQQAVLALMKTLQTEDTSEYKYDHTAAIVALGEIGEPAKECLPKLKEFLNENDEVDYFAKMEAVIAIGKIGAAARSEIPALRRIRDATAKEYLEWEMSDAADEAILLIERSFKESP